MQDAGRPKAAFDAYLKLLDITDKPQEFARYETARVIRRDRWLAARIEEVRAAAAPAERDEMDKRIAARLRDDKLAEFVACFPAHPAANDARLRLAQQAIEKREWTAAEQWLRAVARGGDAAQQNAAIARLAAILRETKQTDDAARCYDILRGRLAQAVCLDGKTGGQLFAALPEDDPVRRALAAPAKWPRGKVRVEAPDKPDNNGNNSQRVPLAQYWEEDPFGTPFSVEVDMNQRRIAASDDLGRKRWEVVPMADKTATSSGSSCIIPTPAARSGRWGTCKSRGSATAWRPSTRWARRPRCCGRKSRSRCIRSSAGSASRCGCGRG